LLNHHMLMHTRLRVEIPYRTRMRSKQFPNTISLAAAPHSGLQSALTSARTTCLPSTGS
jgi:hypothetical protein